MNRKWEDITDYTERLMVPGGWIVRSHGDGIHQVFIKDSNHGWELTNENQESEEVQVIGKPDHELDL